MALNAPYLSPNPHRPRAFGGKGGEGLKKEITSSNRIDGHVTIVDITELEKPRLIRRFRISGNPDLAFVGDGFVLIPAGRQGLIKFEL